MNSEMYYRSHNIPIKFLDYTLEGVDVDWMKSGSRSNTENFARYLKYLESIEQKLNAGIGLFCSGSFGVGKTMLEAIALKSAIQVYSKYNEQYPTRCDLHKECGFITGASLVQLFSFDVSERERERRGKLETIELLVIDELGKLPLTGKSKEVMFIENVIRIRCFDKKPTFITSQGDLKDLEQTFSAALVELLKEYFVKIHLVGKSYREQIQN